MDILKIKPENPGPKIMFTSLAGSCHPIQLIALFPTLSHHSYSFGT